MPHSDHLEIRELITLRQATVSSLCRRLRAPGFTDVTTFSGMDKGGANLIADGRIKVKSLVSIERFTKNGLLLSDGTELPADLVVFA